MLTELERLAVVASIQGIVDGGDFAKARLNLRVRHADAPTTLAHTTVSGLAAQCMRTACCRSL